MKTEKQQQDQMKAKQVDQERLEKITEGQNCWTGDKYNDRMRGGRAGRHRSHLLDTRMRMHACMHTFCW